MHALQGRNFQNSLPMLLLYECKGLDENQQKTINLRWIPSEISIPENKAAYKAAKYALDLPITQMGIHDEDYMSAQKNGWTKYNNWLIG